ncbi:MAG: alpha/beta hydrolase [Bacteroidota bacterium]
MPKDSLIGEFGELKYHIHTGGSKVLLAFHGFGQDDTALLPCIEKLKFEYTVYSFRHFFHGSIWNFKDKPLTKGLWKKIIEELLSKHNIDSFELLGFSLGAKVALSTLELFVKKVRKVHLLAPDGIQTNVWYNLATYPSIFRYYFRSMIVQPKRFYSILNGLHRFHLVDNSLLRFAASQMDTASKRHRVYYSWIVYKKLNVNRYTLIELMNQSQCQVAFWLGRYDKVILRKGIESFANQLDKKSLRVLECGHSNLINKVALELNH